MKVGFIGFGNMARALAEGFVRSGALQPASIGACARDWEKLNAYASSAGYCAFRDAAALAAFAELVIVAVKPHQVEEALAPVRGLLSGKAVVSVVAGYDFARYEQILLPGTHHLSTVPNTPVSIGEGVVICERRHSLSADEWRIVSELFSCVGQVFRVETALLGVAGTVCGCGPAFVFLFMEALADAAVKHGIARADAYRMVAQTVAGAGKLQLATGLHPGVLKDAVCSPGDTTIRGVAELERKGLRGAVIDAVDAIEGRD